MQLIYFHVPGSRTLQDNHRVVWNDSSTIYMLNDKVKHKEIDLYVEHEINIVIFLDDDLLLTIATVKGSSDGNQGGEGLNGEGVEVVCSKGGKGSEGLTREGVEVAGNKGGDSGKCGEGFERLNGEGVEVVGTKGGESFEGLNGEGVKVASNKGGEGGEVEGGEGGEDFKCLNEEGVEVVGSKGDEGDGGLNSGVEEANDEGYEDESDSSLEDDYDYLMKAMYFSDGDNDEEFQEASQKWREVEGKTSRKAKEKIVDETKSKSSRK
ncbi:hypothetical protein PVK06_001659 [Gossypium arboreum]|uniref:Uncharacterized protein n=1 Tax=Gossypium arboreum TaxID=29729 RepID=A0ABR0R1N4_GOSAR|nr:hypothetical protein PVK06_001659 [Gossypium arboreum]